MATRDLGLAGQAECMRRGADAGRRAATVVSRDHATALRRNNAEFIIVLSPYKKARYSVLSYIVETWDFRLISALK